MDALTFLKGLPAILGAAGFFAYLWVGQARIGGDLLKTIVEKLRAAPNLPVDDYSSLTPARIGRLVESDARVREAVNDQDLRLLRLLIVLQHGLTVVVLLVCAALVGLGIWLITRPDALAVVPNPPAPVADQAHGLLVDLDPVIVEWSSGGSEERISVFLENVESSSRSTKKVVSSNARSVTFLPDEFRGVLAERGYRKRNRIRSVVEWSIGTKQSETRDLLVGIQASLMLNGRLITPTEDRPIHTLMATIDDSTEFMPSNYCFSGALAGWTESNPIVIALKSCNSKGSYEVMIPELETLNWDRSAGFVYFGPDDSKIVRTCITGQPKGAAARCDWR
jgi:hypothetical protein